MEEKDNKNNLDKLKENYKEIQEKYKLPDFEELNKDFQIEKVSEGETDFIVREIRKFMADKFSNYLRFIEAILHPANVPMFVFSIIKSISVEEKKELAEIYKELAKIEIWLIELDIEFNEKKEIEFIKENYKSWNKMKKNILGVIKMIKNNWDNKFEVNGKSYFG